MWANNRRVFFASAFFSILSACSGPARAGKRTFTDLADLRASVIAILKREPAVTGVTASPDDSAKFHVSIGEWSVDR